MRKALGINPAVSILIALQTIKTGLFFGNCIKEWLVLAVAVREFASVVDAETGQSNNHVHSEISTICSPALSRTLI